MGDDYARIVVARYTQKSIKSSIYQDIQDLIAEWNLSSYLEITGDLIVNKANGNQLMTHAFRLSDLTQTAKGTGISNPNFLFIDEFTEVNDEQEYIKLIDSFRKKGVEKKIIMAFNPTVKSSWIFKRWYLPDGKPNPKWSDDHEFLHLTYLDNKENLDEAKVAEWERAKMADPEYYKHHILGEWSDVGEGQVYKHFQFSKWEPDPTGEIIYGADFGYKDPMVLIKVIKKSNRIWVEEIIYETEWTIEDVVQRMNALKIPKSATIYCDAAMPGYIETIRRSGFTHTTKAFKGPGSKKVGIDRIKSYEVFVNPKSENIIYEYQNYHYKTGKDEPADGDDHALDALIYCLSYEKVGQGKYAVTSGRARPEIW